jgi:molecular chaperone GrpE (heat shock protein)
VLSERLVTVTLTLRAESAERVCFGVVSTEVPGAEDQIVVEELQGGYEINGKVIRPSQVVISKKA